MREADQMYEHVQMFPQGLGSFDNAKVGCNVLPNTGLGVSRNKVEVLALGHILCIGRGRAIQERINGSFHDVAYTTHSSARMLPDHLLEELLVRSLCSVKEVMHICVTAIQLDLFNIIGLGVQECHEDRVAVVYRVQCEKRKLQPDQTRSARIL